VKPSCIIEALAGIVSAARERASERCKRSQSGRVPLSSKKTKVWGNDVQRKIDSLHQLNGQSNPVHRLDGARCSLLAACLCALAFSLARSSFRRQKSLTATGEHLALTHDQKSCLLVQVDGCVRVAVASEQRLSSFYHRPTPQGKTNDKAL
jgi:hypothetical protein